MVSSPLRKRARARWLGLTTAIGLGNRGIFIPYRHTSSIEPIDYPSVETLLRAQEHQLAHVLERLQSHEEAFRRFGGAAPNPRFEQDWFPRLDLAAAYALIREHRPSRIVEIGSGHSTRVLARAIGDGGLDCELICIDPAPRATIRDLPVTHLATLLSQAPDEILSGLGDGHVLFIDSSHIAMPGSDVDFLFNRIMPRIGKGCLVHVHDIFLPRPYPREWLWRGYNEQLLLAAMLHSGALEVLFASSYVASRPDLLARAPVLERLPLLPGAHESSFWARKVSEPIG